jgi:hypothetical protein
MAISGPVHEILSDIVINRLDLGVQLPVDSDVMELAFWNAKQSARAGNDAINTPI